MADTDTARAIGEAGQALLRRRQEICADAGIGLTDLYNQHEEGAWTDLGELHRQLDSAILSAYGWDDLDIDDSVSVNQRLFELNREVVAGERQYAGPGIAVDS